jgi:hypothetical protein
VSLVQFPVLLEKTGNFQEIQSYQPRRSAGCFALDGTGLTKNTTDPIGRAESWHKVRFTAPRIDVMCRRAGQHSAKAEPLEPHPGRKLFQPPTLRARARTVLKTCMKRYFPTLHNGQSASKAGWGFWTLRRLAYSLTSSGKTP